MDFTIGPRSGEVDNPLVDVNYGWLDTFEVHYGHQIDGDVFGPDQHMSNAFPYGESFRFLAESTLGATQMSLLNSDGSEVLSATLGRSVGGLDSFKITLTQAITGEVSGAYADSSADRVRVTDSFPYAEKSIPVPLPAAALLGLLGLGTFAAGRARRRRIAP